MFILGMLGWPAFLRGLSEQQASAQKHELGLLVITAVVVGVAIILAVSLAVVVEYLRHRDARRLLGVPWHYPLAEKLAYQALANQKLRDLGEEVERLISEARICSARLKKAETAENRREYDRVARASRQAIARRARALELMPWLDLVVEGSSLASDPPRFKEPPPLVYKPVGGRAIPTRPQL